ncbi:MAG: class I SAM-dependent methyltransferase, partial [Anaerolineae bacterium]
MPATIPFDSTFQRYQQTRRAHWDAVMRRREVWRGAGRWYHRRIQEVYRFLIPPGQRILEIGCGEGDLLAALRPSFGLGVDFSQRAIQHAHQRHPELNFLQADAHALPFSASPFDVILFSDTINDLW